MRADDRDRVPPADPGEPSSPASLHGLVTRHIESLGERFFFHEGAWNGAETLLDPSRRWEETLGSTLVPGDRILVAARPAPAVLSLLLAAMKQGLTIALAGEREDLSLLAGEVDARAVFPDHDPLFAIASERAGSRDRLVFQPRESRFPPSPRARFLIRTSGTSGGARWVALSERNVVAVLESHVPRLGLQGGTVLSSLPWAHSFGLVLELLAGLSGGARIVRAPDFGRDPETLIELAASHPVTHFNAVPLAIERLAERPGGRAFLAKLQGGIVGGAPITPRVARVLSGTRLCAGYGQTEASPGIALGDPGEFSPNWLGRPAGCEAWIGPGGVLTFRGDNACLGTWDPSLGLRLLDPGRAVPTGDLARSERGGFVFEGRAAASFKLANGRFVEAARIEQSLISRGGAQAALLRSRDGRSLELILTTGDGRTPPAETLAACLGPLMSLPLTLSMVDGSFWIRTRKGEIDRMKLKMLDASTMKPAA